ncbi:MAG: segregation/condensation protein A [Candidatus Latescibacterota bacterium]
MQQRSFLRREMEPDGVAVRLDVFEGPLDLLLYLIQKHELDIYDIPIAYITSEYLHYVEGIGELDLETAGDFLVMAATLMGIKSRMLLPFQEEEGVEEDPRKELVRRLLEYQEYKDLAGELRAKEEAQRQVFSRNVRLEVERNEEESDIGVFELTRAFLEVMGNLPRLGTHQVVDAEVSVEERIAFVLTCLQSKRRVAFVDLMQGVERIVMVVTFIAILELIKVQKVVVRKGKGRGEVWVCGKGEG